MGRQKFEIETRTINPELAKIILKDQARNRSVALNHVRWLTGAIRRGEWVLGPPLLFTDEGKLIDGQHRLLAIIAAKRAEKFVCVSGYDYDSTFGVIDFGRKRSLANFLGLEFGSSREGDLATAVKALHFYRYGTPKWWINTAVTFEQAKQAMQREPEIALSVERMNRKVGRFVNVGICCLLHYLFIEDCGDETAVNAFFDDLAKGEGLGTKDPVYVLREDIIRNKGFRTQYPAEVRIAKLIRAWNHELHGNKVTQLRWKIGDRFPKIGENSLK